MLSASAGTAFVHLLSGVRFGDLPLSIQPLRQFDVATEAPLHSCSALAKEMSSRPPSQPSRILAAEFRPGRSCPLLSGDERAMVVKDVAAPFFHFSAQEVAIHNVRPPMDLSKLRVAWSPERLSLFTAGDAGRSRRRRTS
ncbi:hypothetical protein SODALDRAFT_363162 [Sodiomyces alkalinus F11]|uniref:Uncharacterized protein n=1 Tax=Sodiomyces alkalinus (strain CBS 110278 / VKM F-3762 / F11) TaxID=1314773 RepID=A0A3N2PLW3_SODAK|nr:hypothetical protein SODALDRAFT_363162 [Sodiomyces alkalinus F11]ROT35346.1 hypothetical protein SODALDRAFT_363162 [Sodiomyces alkalinus F11]